MCVKEVMNQRQQEINVHRKARPPLDPQMTGPASDAGGCDTVTPHAVSPSHSDCSWAPGQRGWVGRVPGVPVSFHLKKRNNNPRSNIPISHLSPAVPDPVGSLSAAGVTTFNTNLMQHTSFLQPQVQSPLPDCSQPPSEVALGKGASGIPHRHVNHRGWRVSVMRMPW